MTAMLGFKLDGALDRRVSDFASRKGQAKSEIGRRALIEYLNRHEHDDEFKRQLDMLVGERTDDIEDLLSMPFRDPDWR